jgi:dihydrofolate synthase/folylpolyglutamate synthase
MKYQDALDYMFQALPMFQRIGPAAYKKDLGNTLALCEALGHPEGKIQAIHIAGTNGKGSLTHLLGAAYQSAGYKTGYYTSPHYKDYRERIKINGAYISPRFVTKWIARHKTLLDQIQPSFFEMTVALAFDYFVQEQVDIAIIETGLGGRLDSTNVLTPLLSVITNISLDHMAMLGNTLPEIAGEKAGIIKPGVPVVIGERQTDTDVVFERKANLEASPITFAQDHWSCSLEELPGGTHSQVQLWRQGANIPSFKVQMGGPYLHKNLVTALEALYRMPPPYHLGLDQIQKAWANWCTQSKFIGRWQWLSKDPDILVDSAHNEGGLKLLFQGLPLQEGKQLHVVFGTVADKETSVIFPLFPQSAKYYFVKARVPRAMDVGTLKTLAATYALHGSAYTSVRKGLAAAKASAAPGDLILVTGSIFAVAEVL